MDTNKSNKGFIIPMIIALVAVLIIGGLYISHRNAQVNNSANVQSALPVDISATSSDDNMMHDDAMTGDHMMATSTASTSMMEGGDHMMSTSTQ